MKALTKDEIVQKLKTDFTYWYHKIDLGDGVFTPGFEYQNLWNNIRKVRDTIDYKNKRVLDIASFDGLWAFEAEKLGAKEVIATDCLYRSFKNFMFCKEILNSQCIPYFNVNAYNLHERLDVYFEENYNDEKPYDRLFDIVQHLGLLYHLRDPMLSLSQARSCLKTNGHLLIETNVVIDTDESFMAFNGIPFTARMSDNYSVWWVPTVNCLKEMLSATLFESLNHTIIIEKFELPLNDNKKNIPQKLHDGMKSEKQHKIGRLAMWARAQDPSEAPPEFSRELLRTFRNPGIKIH